MTEGIMTTGEVVEMHGTERCKWYFSKYKKLGGHKQQLHNELDAVYVNWENVKVGRKNNYKLGEKRSVKMEIQDSRKGNGKSYPTDLENNALMLILLTLKNRSSNEDIESSCTINQWLKIVGFINEEILDATKSKYEKYILLSETEKLVEQNIIDDSSYEFVVGEIIKKMVESGQNIFLKLINELKREGIVQFRQFTKAKCNVPEQIEYYEDGEIHFETEINKKYIELDSYVVNQIAKTEKKLQEKPKYQSLTPNMIRNLKNMPLVKEYDKDFLKVLNRITDINGERLYIALTFETYSLALKSGNHNVEKYLNNKSNELKDSYNSDKNKKSYYKYKEHFEKEYKDYLLDLAKSREVNEIKKEKELLEGNEFGSKINANKYREKKSDKSKYLKLKKDYSEIFGNILNYYYLGAKKVCVKKKDTKNKKPVTNGNLDATDVFVN